MEQQTTQRNEEATDVDVIVVGAVIGGLYAIHRFKEQGLSVLGLEKASGVGGVWFHNRYPGARVDVESIDYCYQFSADLFREWRWTERYATQAELRGYLNHVADRFDIRRHILFETPLQGARWRPEEARYHVEAGDGRRLTCRFLVMATGNLSAARAPDFPGLSEFEGEWVQASHWPDRPVQIAGRRVAVIGTGSSGVQTIPVLAAEAEHLYVMQRTPNFSVPARNGPLAEDIWSAAADDVPTRRAHLLTTRAAITGGLKTSRSFAECDEAERAARIQEQWAIGGQGMNRVFSDQGSNQAANDYVANFVRDRIRETVEDPQTAGRLCPYDHPIGTRRLCVDTDYYKTYNRDNVNLVDIAADPIVKITANGIQTRDAHYEVDLIVFALGFNAFRGVLDGVDIRNERGEHPTGRWNRGPRTLLGLMTAGFPNFFFLTGPGSPSVLANMMMMNEEHVNFVGDLIGYAEENGYDTIAADPDAEQDWIETVAQSSANLLRLGVKNYMVHVNQDDGSRIFMPYVGGLDTFVRICKSVSTNDFKGFVFGRAERPAFVADADRARDARN